VADANVYLQWRWSDRYRHDRIMELIAQKAARGKITVDDVMDIQKDIVDISCRDAKSLLAEYGGESGRRLLEELNRWGCAMRTDSVTAARYATFLYNLQKLTWGRFNVSITFVPFEVTLASIKRGLVNRSVVETAAEALKATSPWGQLHKYSLTHVLGSAFPGLNYRQMEAPGSRFTVNVAPGFQVSQGPSVRFIVAFGDGVYMMLPGGPDCDPLTTRCTCRGSGGSMSRWIRYLGLLTPLAAAASPLHMLNAALVPLLGGLIYGYFTERRREVVLSPLAAMVPVVAVLLYYVAVDAVMLSRYFSVFPLIATLWVALWLFFFVLRAAAGYLLRLRR
jgi:hypothetical protein